METVKDRLLQFLRAEGITNSEFARKMGLSVAYIGAMRKSMPEEKVARLVKLYPHLNRDWLLYGEGEMLLPARDDNSDRMLRAFRRHIVPMLPVEAYAGNLQMWSQGVAAEDCEQVVSPVKGADFAIRVSGDSMEPTIPNGAIIFIKKINDRPFIPWGVPMVIDTESGVLVKQVTRGDADDSIKAISFNPRYEPISIPKESIYGLYKVMATLILNS